MSITDSGTPLDTAWTEQSVVAFTSGVLSTIANCASEVEAKLKRGTLSASTQPTQIQVYSWLKRAKLELAEVKDFTFKRKYAYATLTAGDYRVSLPPDYDGGLIARDTTNDRFLPFIGRDIFDKRYPDLSAETSEEPEAVTVKNMELWIAPPVNASTVIEIDYNRSGAETTTDDFSWLPELDRFRCCDYAVAQSFESLHMWNEADRYFARWNESTMKARRADGRRKWKRRMSAISVFQEAVLKTYQQS